MSKIKVIAIIAVVGLAIFAYFFIPWYVNRSFNYSMGYESQVESTVCKMVKREYLVNPDDC